MPGITPDSLARHGNEHGAVPFLLEVKTVADATVFYPKGFAAGSGSHQSFRIAAAFGVMTGAGDVGDTVKLVRVASGSAVDITDTLSVAALGDKATFVFTSFDDGQNLILEGDLLRVVTASDALCNVYIMCMPASE